MLKPSLAAVQHWMHDFIIDPGSDQEAAVAASLHSGLPQDAVPLLFSGSATLEPFERIMIYRGQYLARMSEALAGDYPAVLHFLGEDRFDRLVEEYVQVFPSRSYTLNRLGTHFCDFLATRTWLPRLDFLKDLARLEQAVCQVFDENETVAIRAETLRQYDPSALSKARFTPIAALRLLEFNYPVSAYLESTLLETTPPPLRKGPCFVAVYRRNYLMYRLDLTRSAFLFLQGLMAQATLEGALDEVLRRTRGISGNKLFAWCSRWMAEGFFQAVTVE